MCCGISHIPSHQSQHHQDQVHLIVLHTTHCIGFHTYPRNVWWSTGLVFHLDQVPFWKYSVTFCFRLTMFSDILLFTLIMFSDIFLFYSDNVQWHSARSLTMFSDISNLLGYKSQYHQDQLHLSALEARHCSQIEELFPMGYLIFRWKLVIPRGLDILIVNA